MQYFFTFNLFCFFIFFIYKKSNFLFIVFDYFSLAHVVIHVINVWFLIVDDGLDMIIYFDVWVVHYTFNFVKFMFKFFYFAINVSLSQQWHYLLKLINIDKVWMLTNFLKAFNLLYQRNFYVKILNENVQLSFLDSFFLNVIKLHIPSKMLTWIKLMHFGEGLL